MQFPTCVTIAESNVPRLKKNLKKALKKTNFAELRLDYLSPNKVPHALEAVKKDLRRCVCTLRLSKEGGKFSGSEKNRVSILKLIAEYNPLLLDVEYTTLTKSDGLLRYLRNSKTDLLVSWHDFKKTPSLNFLDNEVNHLTLLVWYILRLVREDYTLQSILLNYDSIIYPQTKFHMR